MQLNYFWTLILGAFRRFAPSGTYVGIWVCDRCGFALTGRVEGSTSLFSCELAIDSFPPKSSPCKHVVTVTPSGKFSISCGQSRCGDSNARRDSGATDTTSCLPKNSSNHAEPTT